MSNAALKNNLATKLLAVQKEVGKISKDSENPFFNSKYFDINGLLATVKPILNKHGILLMQPLDYLYDGGKAAITTMFVDVESGEEMRFVHPIVEVANPQKAGSAITYFRRYALQSALALEAEDDDANKASGKKTNKDDEPF